MVKILPITSKYLQVPISTQNVQQNTENIYQSSVMSGRELAFCGSFIPNYNSLDLYPATNLDGIHCPVCGIQTLSDKSVEALKARASKVNTAKELAALFGEYQDYIPMFSRDIFVTDTSVFKDEDTVLDYYKVCRRLAYYKLSDNIFNVKEYLDNYSSTLPVGAEKSLVQEVNDALDPSKGYADFKINVSKLLKSNYVDNSAKVHVSKNLYPNVRNASLSYDSFRISDYKTISSGELAEALVANVFRDSTTAVTKIQKKEPFVNSPNNTVLVCSSCYKKSSPHMFMDFSIIKRPEIAKANMLAYLGDLSKAMGEGNLHNNKLYFNNFAFYIDKLSHGRVNFSETEIRRIQNIREIVARRDSFAPIEQTKVDVPCACCGHTMLPHSVRLNIHRDLLNCESVVDYAEVLKKYDKYVGHYAKDHRDIFLNVVNDNPDISIEDFITIYTQKVDRFAEYETDAVLDEFEKTIEYVKSIGNSEQLNIALKVRDNLNEYISAGLFSDFNYSNMLRNVFADIDLDDPACTKGIYILLNDLKEIAYKTTLVKPNDKYDNSDKDPVYTILFNLFKSDVATADYFVAAKKGGKRSKENLIGLCKGCNSLKNNKGVAAWYAQNLSVRKNFRKHLDIVDYMAKEGIIEGYDTWAAEMSEAMYELTHQKYDIRDRYKKD